MALDGRIASIEIYSVTIPQDDAYLGALGPGESVNSAGLGVSPNASFWENATRLD